MSKQFFIFFAYCLPHMLCGAATSAPKPVSRQFDTAKRRNQTWHVMGDISAVESEPPGALNIFDRSQQKLWETACRHIALNQHEELDGLIKETDICTRIYACTDDPQKISKCTIVDVMTLMEFAIACKASAPILKILINHKAPIQATYVIKHVLPIAGDTIGKETDISLDRPHTQPIFYAIEQRNLVAFSTLLPYWHRETRQELRDELNKARRSAIKKDGKCIDDMLALVQPGRCVVQ